MTIVWDFMYLTYDKTQRQNRKLSFRSGAIQNQDASSVLGNDLHTHTSERARKLLRFVYVRRHSTSPISIMDATPIRHYTSKELTRNRFKNQRRWERHSPFEEERKGFWCAEFDWNGDWFTVFSESPSIDSSTAKRRRLKDRCWTNSSEDSIPPKGLRFVVSKGLHGNCLFAPATVWSNVSGEATSIAKYLVLLEAKKGHTKHDGVNL